MVTKKELEQELQTLKRKLNEKEEELEFSKSKINKQKEELDTSHSKINKQEHLLQKLKDRIECPVCLDVPRSGPVPVCPNGHIVCLKCKRDSCPSCRIVIGDGKSLLALVVLEGIEHKCIFEDCSEIVALEDIEKHEKVCPHRSVECPDEICSQKVPLSKLVDHLINSEKCCYTTIAPRVAKKGWNRINYTIRNVAKKSPGWSVHVYSFSDEILAIYPMRSNGQFYFVIVMFASEKVCSKYNFEMYFHEHGSEALESEVSVKFRGSPFSIDAKKTDLNMYGTSERLMTELLKKSVDENAFSLSFKISKKEKI